MMQRFTMLLWMVAIVASALGLYFVKYRVQAIQGEIAQLSRDIEDEQESLHVVAAEWAYLNQPERLQQLSQKYLRLKPVSSPQMADVASIPYPNQGTPDGVMPASVSTVTAPEDGE